jgi:hypothetical protein
MSNLFIGPKVSQAQELFEPAPGSIRGMRQRSLFTGVARDDENDLLVAAKAIEGA